jgi:hypothetical protein
MTTHPRARHAFWGDIRFLIGIALVILSMVGVWLVVSTARDTTPVLQANRTIVQGAPLTSDDFRVVEVSLGAAADEYLAPQNLTAGLIASRTVGSGELLPSIATADAQSGRTTNIVIESSVALPAHLGVGTPVELWYSPVIADSGELDSPRILAADAVVASVPENDGMLAQRSAAVEVIVDRADIAEILAAVTDGAALSVVPRGSGS